ncbi:restriction endonuclease subunit S [Salegentibacter sp. Hel_I_6]|uniref:restriction endonuclease subunit S n=1 Tax=Salegentibacter sp. Hel_I_6 TaxID=1250278 RepID=UPI000A5D474F|nr:restriction endonuclease subunit S [Salegentibacter sp. Hel_I_6]
MSQYVKYDMRPWQEVLTIKNGKNQKKVANPNGEFPIYGSGGVMGYADNFLCRAGSTIIGRKGSINNPIYVNENFWNVDTAFGLEAGDDLDAKFLYYFCITYNFLKHNKATTLPSLTKADLLKIEMPLPPLKTQHKIAAILDEADKLRRLNKKLIKKYEQLSQSLFLEMFGDPVSNSKNFDTPSLSSITTKIGSGATPKGGKEAYFSEGISLIRSLNIHNNNFKYKNLAFIDEGQAKRLSNVTVEENDVLFNITGASVCRTAIVPNGILPARVNQHVAILRPKKNKLNSIFLCHLLISKNFQKKLEDLASKGGATRQAINKSQLENLPIPLPKIEQQLGFEKSIHMLEKQKTQAQQALAQSEELFNSLMQRAFKGELVK